MKENKIKAAWNNCKECNCGSNDCHPNNHRLCGICGNQNNILYTNRRIIRSAYNDRNSKYGWNVDHSKPISIGGTNKNSNLRATHIRCNKKRKNN